MSFPESFVPDTWAGESLYNVESGSLEVSLSPGKECGWKRPRFQNSDVSSSVVANDEDQGMDTDTRSPEVVCVTESHEVEDYSGRNGVVVGRRVFQRKRARVWSRVKEFIGAGGGCRSVLVGLPTEDGTSHDPLEAMIVRVGAVFHSKADLHDAVGQSHIECHGQYRVKKSDRGRLQLVCVFVGCSFGVKAVGENDVWVVTNVTDHTCQVDPHFYGPRRMRSSTLGAYYAGRVAKGITSLVPKAMIAELMHRNGIATTYGTALRAKHNAMERLYGDENTSFGQLPSYLYMLERVNPGSFTALDVDAFDGKFRNVFFALAASVIGFRNFGRPVIVLDATHLKGKYNGVVFVAVTQDGNRHLFPLGVGIGHKEDDTTWSWFLTQLRRAYPPVDGLVIVSDEHKSIHNAVARVYPEGHHCLCFRHMQTKIKKSGKVVAGLFHEAAFAYSGAEFRRAMQNIIDMKPVVGSNLVKKGPERWARTQCPRSRFEFMTSNAAESFNSRIKEARKLPITSVLESIRCVIEQWFFERRTTAETQEKGVADVISSEVLKAVRRSMQMETQQISHFLFSVREGVEVQQVDLANKICSCGYFQQMLVPCGHVAAAARKLNHDVLAYVGRCYSTDVLIGMWSGLVFPIPDPTAWRVPSTVMERVCYPPAVQRQAGRPRMSRFEEGRTTRRQRLQSCSRCGGSGHNVVSCAVYVEQPFEAAASAPVNVRRENDHDVREF